MPQFDAPVAIGINYSAFQEGNEPDTPFLVFAWMKERRSRLAGSLTVKLIFAQFTSQPV